MKKTIDLQSVSHTGRRKENQDRVFCKIISKKPLIVVKAVADGMGGHHRGDLAAEMAISVIERMTETVKFKVDHHNYNRNVIEKWVEKCNKKINDYAKEKNVDENMGTTLTGVVIVEDSYYVFNVGDSRTYIITENEIHQLTIDHTADQDALKRGVIDKSEVGKTPYSNALMRALGSTDSIEVDVFPKKVDTAFPLDEDIILLSCSDGLWGKVSSNEIFTELKGRSSIKESIENLTSIGFIKGSSDNISITALELGKVKRGKLLEKKYVPIEELVDKNLKKRKTQKKLIYLLLLFFILLLSGLGYLILKDNTGNKNKKKATIIIEDIVEKKELKVEKRELKVESGKSKVIKSEKKEEKDKPGGAKNLSPKNLLPLQKKEDIKSKKKKNE